MHLHQEEHAAQPLRDRDFVGIIAPRIVETLLAEAWTIGEAVRQGLPEEYHYATNGPGIVRHDPDRDDEIMHDIAVPCRGAVFLVGAGRSAASPSISAAPSLPGAALPGAAT